MSDFEVFIGLDFGTSYSKICYNVNGDLYVYIKNDSPFIPTEIYYSTNDKEIYINNDINIKHIIPVKYFKYSMIFEPIINIQINNALPLGLEYKQINILFSIYFLACIIKDVKREIKNKYKNQPEIAWEINMSAPINDYYGEIYDLYYNVLNSAYNLSDNEHLENIHINTINDIYNKVKNNRIEKHNFLSIHPELFIETVYFTSNKLLGQNYGSYIVMDIGGGTVDIGILWKRKWINNQPKYELVVINIIKYGVEIVTDELKNKGITKQDIDIILKKGIYNEMLMPIKKYFNKHIEKMIDIEKNEPRDGINNINNKRIYYTGGGCNLEWYKNIVKSISKNNIKEDKIPIELIPINYNKNQHDINRLIIAIELARPVDSIEMNLGRTKIINGEKIFPGDDFSKIEVTEANIKRPEKIHKNQTYDDLQDRQKELYGDDPI